MKKHFLTRGFIPALFPLIGLAILTYSCQKDEKIVTDEPSLSVSPEVTAIRFSADGQTAFNGQEQISPSFIVTTNLESWNVEVSPEEAVWCHAEQTSDGRGFTVSADVNELKESPVAATVTVTAGDAEPVVITVTQDGIAVNTLSISPDKRELSFTVDGGAETFTVETDAASWDAVSDSDWCVISKDEEMGNFTVTVGVNSSTEDVPAANVTVSAGNADPIVISVLREARNTLSISPEQTSVEFSAQGGSETFTVTTNAADWNAVVDSDWCSVASDASTFTITAQPNETNYERQPAVVTLTAGNASLTISVSQAGKEAGQVYKLGDYWPDPDAVYENGTLISGTAAQGIVIWLDPQSEGYDASGDVPQGTSGKIVSIAGYSNADYNGLSWGNGDDFTGASDLEDGRKNMDAVKSYLTGSELLTWEDFPAFNWVISEMNGRTEWDSDDEWYLPALKEVKQINAGLFGMVWEEISDWANGNDPYATIPGYMDGPAQNFKNEINARRVAAGGIEIADFVWTSSENTEEAYYAFYVNCNFGQYGDDWSKSSSANTVAIKIF